MKHRYMAAALLSGAVAIAPLGGGSALTASAAPESRTPLSAPGGTFEAGKGTFLLNGEPFLVKAAELHYPRIPREYWEQRIQMCKALGMNTICLYVFWNAHESKPGEFDFTGNNDLAEFIRLCQANGMYVILRPGPYVCAEWEMGGLPWWLLKDRDIRLRENDPRFLERVGLFQQEVAHQVKGLTIAEGGPIIMVQVENEYGSYGKDKEYIANVRDMVRRHFGEDVTLFQCDWSSNFLDNGLDDLVWTLNFGTGADIDRQFAPLKEVRPDSPLMCSEFWSGWFDKWGAGHETRPAADMIAGMEEMLEKGISFSLYMTHGGTNWGHWAGANSPGFAPDVTSYDYDAPINEQGAPTQKYHLLREMIARHSDSPLPAIPDTIAIGAIAPFRLTEVAPLRFNLPEAVADTTIRSMEQYDQGFGSILYRTLLPVAVESGDTLVIEEPHDYAQVFVNGEYVGKLDRRMGEKYLPMGRAHAGDTLDILVEAMGRINFGRAIRDFKGITDSVEIRPLSGAPVNITRSDWMVYNLPDEEDLYKAMEFVPLEDIEAGGGHLPRGVYRGTFNVNKPADTFLDMSTWGKGLVYVNGHPLGRMWEIGPQQTLYLPGCWLRAGENEIMVFDITGPREAVAQGLSAPIIDRLQLPGGNLHRAPGEALDLTGLTPVAEGELEAINQWQRVDFPLAATGRYLVLEALDACDGGDVAAIAELYLVDGRGERLSREPWTVRYADSEELKGNHTADKIFDLQESTYWQSDGGEAFPHAIVIDLGSQQTVAGLEYLPRMEAGAPGAVRNFRIFISPEDFKY